MTNLFTFVMKALEFILIILQVTTSICRRKHPQKSDELTSSEETIENLLYYKDCKHKSKDPPSTEAPPKTTEFQKLKQPVCPCPRMCCSMCCECGGNGLGGGSSIFGNVAPNNMIMGGRDGMSSMGMMEGMGGMGGIDMMAPMAPPNPPRQPLPPVQKKKKEMLPNAKDMSMLPPLGARRGTGFTREHIKSLIAQDEDIKKILKDLVKVTMSKVVLIDGVPAPQPIPRPARVQGRSQKNNNRGNLGEYEEDY